MNLGQFRNQTALLPDHIEMFTDGSKTEFKYGIIDSATVKEINMTEEPDGSGEKATETVLVLAEQ